MKSSTYRLRALCALFTTTFMLSSCEPTSPEVYEPISVTGQVTDTRQAPLDNAIVRIISPLPEIITTTNEIGYFTFNLQVDSTINYVIEFRKEGYTPRTLDFLAIPERNVSLPVIRLTSTETNAGGTPPDDDEDEEESAGSAFITLQSLSNSTIQVRETGGVESTVFEFIVTDSTGTPVSNSKAATVNFEIASGPNGGETISPSSTQTVNGIARGTLTSGTVSGVVQVRASIVRDGVMMRSNPVSVTISGGLPNNNHFEVNSSQRNIPATSTNPTQISVLLGDRYGNTVPVGTAVYFSTNKGAIYGSASTGADGFAQSQLRTNNTAPGIAKVRVETVSDNSERISREINVLFSGKSRLVVEPSEVDLENFIAQEFSVTLSDESGNPLASGTTLNVSMSHPELTLEGDTQVTLGDETTFGEGVTAFKFRLVNPSRAFVSEDVVIIINTTGPNGSASRQLRFAAPEPPEEPEPVLPPAASIYLDSQSTNRLGVQATGQIESASLNFVVLDTEGNPLQEGNAVDVRFRLGQSPGGGEHITTPTVRTNANGVATATVVSGTRSGVVQIIAELTGTNGETVRTTQPVQLVIHAGLPSQQHFSVITAQYNVPRIFGSQIQFDALVGDKYGNSVPDGTAIYFTTDTGFISGSALTVNGRASAFLTIGNPLQSDGFALITASTVNDAQQQISSSARIIVSGPPIISVTPQTFDIENAEDLRFDYTVQDENGHPMSDGTTITVRAEGDAITLLGDLNITVSGLFSNFSNANQWKNFSFIIDDANPEEINDTPVQITIEVTGPNGEARKTITGRKAKMRP